MRDHIKVIDVGTEITGYNINDYISCRIFYFLMHLHLHSLTKTTKKPLLMQLMKNQNDSMAEKEMAERMQKICASIGTKFKTPVYDKPIHVLAPHMRRASYLMWSESENTYNQEKNIQNEHIQNNPISSVPTMPKKASFSTQ